MKALSIIGFTPLLFALGCEVYDVNYACDRNCMDFDKDAKGCCKPNPSMKAAAPSPVEMVEIPAGEFTMGCIDPADKDCADDEKPSKIVSLPAYKIDRTEVTVAAYAQCVKAGACTPADRNKTCNWATAGRDDHPVNCVDWSQADAYCKWNKKRLPTEEEWVKAARGTDGRKYPWGNEDPTCERVNIRGCGGHTLAASAKTPDVSSFGVQHMGGNVMEWIQDTPVDNGEGEFGPFPWHVLHGASYLTEAKFARNSSRYKYVTRVRDVIVGFRCAQ